MAKKIILEKAEVFELEPGIIENTIYPEVILDIRDVIKIKRATAEIAQKKVHTVLVTSGDLASITKAGREASAHEKYKGTNIASAFVVRSLGQRLIANFYIQINKPAVKTVLFNDRTKALDWLRKKVKENKG